MQRVGIWGIGKNGRNVIKYLKKMEETTIVALTDRNKTKHGMIVEGVVIDAPVDFMNLVKVKAMDAVIFAIPSAHLKEVTALFRNIDTLDGYVFLSDKLKNENLKDALLKIDLHKPRLRFLQINLTQHCNLNCKGCANYSNLIQEPTYADYNQVVADWKQLKRYFWGVERMKLMGGEPLLNLELDKYIKACRKIFPDAHIEIGTNGLLLTEQKKDLYKTMRENNCEFVISLYKPLAEKITKVEELLKKESVNYRIIYSKNQFFKYLSEEPACTKEEGFSHCVAKGCNCLENGYISVCSKPLYAGRLNERFNMKLPVDSGKWYIYNMEYDGWELDEKLNNPFEFCRHCVEPVYYEWSKSHIESIKKEDWFV